MEANKSDITVEVCYAEPERAVVKNFRVSSPASIATVLRLAAADPTFEGVDIEHSAVGIFGRVVVPNQLLNDGDRIEIYRRLGVDPKSARRARAREGRKKP